MLIDSSKLQIIIPVYKPDEKLHDLLQGIKNQSIKDIPLLIIDSGSDKEYLKKTVGMKNVTIKDIDVLEFNHGLTRQMGINMFPKRDIYIFFTQDAVPVDENTVLNLVRSFDDSKVGCAYGRQLPNADANIFAKFARLYNYGSESYIRTYRDRKQYGIKTVFISDSFAAYRKDAMINIGGFPNTNMSEDMYAAAKMLEAGWKIAYQANAKVYHSHNMKIKNEANRYKKIGEFKSENHWIFDKYGKTDKEGIKYFINEMKFVLKKNPLRIPEMIVRDVMKYYYYKFG